jgi:peptidase S24-like protein
MTTGRLPRSTGKDEEIILEALLEATGLGSVTVDGSYMLPTLGPGDLALVVPFLGLPRSGQIVAARIAGTVVIRRLKSIEFLGGRRLYRLRGETRECPTTAVRREDLLGRVGSAVRQGRRFDLRGDPDRPREGVPG